MTTQLIQNIVDGKIEDLVMLPTRKGFGEGLVLAGKENENVVALSADLTESTQVESFKKAYPDRFFEIGVAEQNMASVASGMAAMGKVPFITSYAMFSPGRNWEQIRTTICYNDVPVKVIGCHAGVSVGPDGGTHQALEDVALMRVVPNMIVVIPCDAVEAKKATLAIAKNNLPSYLRLFREKSPVITSEETEFVIGKANVIYESIGSSSLPLGEGLRVGVIANGEMVYRSLLCVKILEGMGVEAGVMNLHTIKPLDKNGIINFAKKYRNILIVEEHHAAGGTGSAVLEMLAQENVFGSSDFEKLKIKLVGVKDRFGQSGGKEELYREYGLDEKSILRKAEEMLELTDK